MKNSLLTILFIFSLFLQLEAKNQSGALSSYEGLHFLVGFMQNEHNYVQNGLDAKIFISTKDTANLKIKFPDRKVLIIKLAPDTLHVEDVESKYENRGKSEKIRDLSISIDSDVPITIYCFSSQRLTSDSYAAIPIENWGNEHVVLSQPNNVHIEKLPSGNTRTINRESEFMIISAYDSTIVHIIPSDKTQGGENAKDTFDIILNQGETFLVKSMTGVGEGIGDGDLTGTIILSEKPVGVLSGHVRAPVPTYSATRDHLVEQLAPVHTWGKEYIYVPFDVSKYGDIIKIVAREPDTKVIYKYGDISKTYTINNDKLFVEVQRLTEPGLWTADKPVQFAQFMGHIEDDEDNWRDFDPCMVMLPPREQFVQHVMFQTPGNIFREPNQYKHHYVALAVEKEAIHTLRLDKRKLDSIGGPTFTKIKDTDIYWTRIELEQGKHLLESISGNFSGVLFATGKYDSYAMVLGASLRPPKLVDSLDPLMSRINHCEDFDFYVKDNYKDENYVSGLLYAKVNPFQTYNFTYEHKEFKLGDTIAHIKAEIQNPYTDGKIVIFTQDRAGNIKEFEYMYYKTNIKFPSNFNFHTVNWNDSIPRTKTLLNYSKKNIEVLSARVSGGRRVNLYTDRTIPCVLKSGEYLNMTVTFKPNYDSTKLSAKVYLKLSCGIYDTIDVIGTVRAPDLVTESIDFGKVLLGETKTDSIIIENKGNINITMQSIDWTGDTDMFSYDNNIFTFVLPPLTKKKIAVEFAPINRGIFIVNGSFKNNTNISNSFICKGQGVLPMFNSILIDVGQRRLGVQSDTTFSLKNTGDIAGDINFLSFVTKKQDNTISDYLENYSVSNIAISEYADFTVPIIFDNVGVYNIKAQYRTNSSYSEDIFVEIVGIGTLPIISTQDIIFADTEIYKERDTLSKIFFSSGNEDLLIRKVTEIQSDDDLHYDISTLQNKVIAQGESFSLDVSFSPQKGGEHTAILIVESDAMPNYGTKIDTVIIKGKAIIPDLEKTYIEIYSDDFYNCNTNTVHIEIINSGTSTVDLDIVELELLPIESVFEYEDDITLRLPTVLQPNGKFEFDISLLPAQNIISNLVVKAYLFGTEIISKSLEINPIAGKISTNIISNKTYDIGQKYNIQLSGNIPHKVDEGNFQPLYISLLMSDNAFYIDKNESVILSVGNFDYQCQIQRTEEKIIFSTENIKVSQSENWNLGFNFQTLLDNQIDFDILVNVESSDCFLEDNSNFQVHFNDICNRNDRLINYFEEQTFELSPSPISDILTINAFTSSEDVLKMTLFDVCGKKYEIFDEKVLLIGKNVLNFGFKNVPNGIYYLVLQTNAKIEKKTIILNN